MVVDIIQKNAQNPQNRKRKKNALIAFRKTTLQETALRTESHETQEIPTRTVVLVVITVTKPVTYREIVQEGSIQVTIRRTVGIIGPME